MVGAATLITDEKGRLLLAKRSDSRCWGFPGGGVELGEQVEMAARREAREELGVEIGEMELFGVFSGQELFYRYPNGDEVFVISIVYRTHEISGDIHLNSEHLEWGWFSLHDLPEDISPPMKPVLDQFVKKYG